MVRHLLGRAVVCKDYRRQRLKFLITLQEIIRSCFKVLGLHYKGVLPTKVGGYE